MSIKELSTEELQELASGCQDGRRTNKPPKKEYKSVLNFIKDYGIQAGDVRVAAHVIFYEYSAHYKRYLHTSKVKRVAFFHTFAQHFTQVRSNGQRYYMLNAYVDFTEAYLKRAEKHKRSINREQQKRKNKVSSSKPSVEPKE